MSDKEITLSDLENINLTVNELFDSLSVVVTVMATYKKNAYAYSVTVERVRLVGTPKRALEEKYMKDGIRSILDNLNDQFSDPFRHAIRKICRKKGLIP